jgi:hypothetical protein
VAIFEHLTPGQGIRYGKQGLTTGEASIVPGLLVTLETDNTLDIATAADKPDGFAFGDIGAREYRPTKTAFAVGDELTLLTGSGMAAVSVDFFSSGSLPAVQNDLYSAAAGKIATSGTYKFGRCVDLITMYAPTGGTGTATSVAVIRFNFDAYN